MGTSLAITNDTIQFYANIGMIVGAVLVVVGLVVMLLRRKKNK